MGRDGDLRATLRQATAEAHARLDTGWEAHDLTQRSAYVAFLSSMAVALVPLEATLEAAGVEGVLPDWPVRRRSAALLSDLAGLSAPPIAKTSDPGDCSPGEIAGILYVLEGSRLGGKVILRRVLASSSPDIHDNVRFLRHGEGQRLWPAFATWLAADASARADIDGAIAGAHRAFAAFQAAQVAEVLALP
ncbi:biliverdin-producing heme oxygenase [Methylobacterium sp. BTF04]|uniref:biliverdin-producing heme oxygenase n=1 Tax=Methylobacterium sp. BTF04 TaxID=2708300 RepID=UPI0013D0CF07|nr:biliverdin-producing heme oxygenase [Methylobacterium sp. BTF04]NEU11124.1 biliverdin-producing heme oxygenase [Methylobacterium sp. BTF04]